MTSKTSNAAAARFTVNAAYSGQSILIDVSYDDVAALLGPQADADLIRSLSVREMCDLGASNYCGARPYRVVRIA